MFDKTILWYNKIMKIILSPAKKMNEMDIAFNYKKFPIFVEEANTLKECLKEKDVNELARIMQCNDSIALLNYNRYQNMDLTQQLSPAVFTYEGLAYQHLAPHVMTEEQLNYIEKHLIILSGLYGVLNPFDGIRPYRLEMQTKVESENINNLYEFWGSKIADEVYSNDDIIINLASNEYSKCITPYLNEKRRMITCIFAQNIKGKLKVKPTEAKMCRGYMVRYMAENKIEEVEEIKKFDYRGYIYNEEQSSNDEWVFIRHEE